ncbi:MAG: carboxy terminal-processing peptidase [Oligoflexales bacterium]|nr:carboxy terminal-processing peptidase [Oligoflexales bacterium]
MKLNSNLKNRFMGFFLSLLLLLSAFPAQAMECSYVRQLIDFFLKNHYSIHTLDAEVSRRTLDNFIKSIDPAKVYFYQKDVDDLFSRFSTRFPSLIAKSDCGMATGVFDLYAKRFVEWNAEIKKIIDEKHNFNVDEYLKIEGKNLAFLNNPKDLRERWRQRIKFQHMQLLSTLGSDQEVRQKMHKRYELLLKRHNEITTDDIYEMFLDAFALALDPHSDYFSPTQLEEFRISTRLSLEGIGALLRSEDGITTIQSLVPGGSAEKSTQIMPGDKIVAVGQATHLPVPVIDMDLQEVVKLIRGPDGTEVRLTLRRGDKEFVVPIFRSKIQLQDKAAKSRVYDVQALVAATTATATPSMISSTNHADAPTATVPATTIQTAKGGENYRIGVVDLPSFYMDFEGKQANKQDFKSSSRDVALELEKLKKSAVHAVVVDLRSNGGGSLDEAINLAGLFTGKGPVVQVKGVNGKPQVNSYDGKAVYDGPLIILIDRQSASASEIMVGAIQDSGRGLIIGSSHTFGKGTVQIVNDIDAKLGAIKVTISKFYRPSGSTTQLRGVESNITLPSLLELYEVGEKFYEYALPWDQIDAVPYSNFNLVTPFLPELKTAHEQRLKKDKGFEDIMKAMDDYKKNEKERNQISLKMDKKAEGKDTSSKKPEVKASKDAGTKPVAKEEADKAKAPADDYEEKTSLPPLKDDIHMQEALRIAADYVRLIKKEPLLDLVLPKLEEEKKLALAKEQSEKKVEPKAPAKKPAKPKLRK